MLQASGSSQVSIASITTVSQSTTSAGSAVPAESENTKPDKHASEILPSTSTSKSKPSPAGIVAPVKLNPITVLALLDSVKPASAAAPPPAPSTETLSTLNWNPAISTSLEKFTKNAGCSGQSAKSQT